MAENATTEPSLEREKLNLERESLAVERERLAADRARFAAESGRRHPRFAVALCAILVVALAFAIGLGTGYSLSESRFQKQREDRLAQALSKLGDTSPVYATQQAGDTNLVRRNVSVLVIQ